MIKRGIEQITLQILKFKILLTDLISAPAIRWRIVEQAESHSLQNLIWSKWFFTVLLDVITHRLLQIDICIYTDDKPSSDIVILYYAIQIKIRVWQLVADKSPAAKIETEGDFNMTEGSLKTISFWGHFWHYISCHLAFVGDDYGGNFNFRQFRERSIKTFALLRNWKNANFRSQYLL